MVSVSDPEAIPAVYPAKPGFIKAPFYHTLLPYQRGKVIPPLFGTGDEDIHKSLKTPIAPILSLSNVMTLEKYVDATIERLFAQFDHRFLSTHQVFDLGLWLQMFAFDVMGELTFSQPFGFLERGKDIDDIMEKIWLHFKTVSWITQIPWLDRFLNKNPIAAYFWPWTASPMMTFMRERTQERQARNEDPYNDALNEKDFLSRLISAAPQNPKTPPWAVMIWYYCNVTAGSDSTAVVLRQIWYNLLTHQSTRDKLLEENQPSP